MLDIQVGSDLIGFMKQFHQLGLDQHTKVLALAADEGSIAAMGPAGVGLFSSAAYFNSMNNAKNTQFLSDLKAQFGDKTATQNFIGEPAYDAVMLWAEAVKKAGSIDTKKVNVTLPQVSFDGPRGTIQYQADSHHAALPIYLGQVQSDGSIQIVHSFGVQQPGPQ